MSSLNQWNYKQFPEAVNQLHILYLLFFTVTVFFPIVFARQNALEFIVFEVWIFLNKPERCLLPCMQPHTCWQVEIGTFPERWLWPLNFQELLLDNCQRWIFRSYCIVQSHYLTMHQLLLSPDSRRAHFRLLLHFFWAMEMILCCLSFQYFLIMYKK